MFLLMTFSAQANDVLLVVEWPIFSGPLAAEDMVVSLQRALFKAVGALPALKLENFARYALPVLVTQILTGFLFVLFPAVVRDRWNRHGHGITGGFFADNEAGHGFQLPHRAASDHDFIPCLLLPHQQHVVVARQGQCSSSQLSGHPAGAGGQFSDADEHSFIGP
jgi:hypothetical protein